VAAAKNKIEFIAAARCIGILLVVFGHSYPFDVYISPSLWKIKDFIYMFHMPLFLFLSGYLLTYNTRSAGSYICRRGVRLLVPYFALSVIAFVPKALVQQFLNDSVEFSAWYLIKTELIPRENVWGHFWYIPVVFALCCFGVLILKTMRSRRAAGWVLLAATYLLLFVPQTTDWFALEDLRKTAFYFVLGMMLAVWDPKAHVVSNRCWLPAFPAAVVLFAAVNTTLTSSLIACLMIGFVLHIGGKIPLGKSSLFACVERNSFTIFLLSWPAQAVVEVVCNKLLHFPVPLTMGLMFLAGITVPLACVKIVSLIDKRISMKWIKLVIGM
jgi:fucose 4-O-acetylase-like acetyltransferase